MYQILIKVLTIFLKIIQTQFKSKKDIILENISLRQQLSIYQIKKISPKLTNGDGLFWVALKQVWERWQDHRTIVKPETIIHWHRNRFKKHWNKLLNKNKKPGRKRIKREIRDLIYRMAVENNWGAPRIYSELLMLGFTDVSETTVSRYLRTFKSKHPDKKKQQVMDNLSQESQGCHIRDGFFIIPTISFKILYVFFIVDHKRRIIRHFNVTSHPSALWVIQQLRDAFPFDKVPRYLIMDREKIFSSQVKGFLEHQLRVKPKVTSYQSLWQNGVVERFVLSARTDLFNHIIVFSEDYLHCLMKEYIDYYNGDSCHLSLGRDSPIGRKIQQKAFESCKVKSISKLGGLQHRYEWKQVA